jgi:anti-sigma B factor antagonist
MFEIRMGGQGEVVLEGRLDAAQCDKALRFLDAVATPRDVDLGALEYISSAGLGVLLKTQKRAMAAGRGLRLLNVNRHIFDILRYAGFDKLFEVTRAGGAPPA